MNRAKTIKRIFSIIFIFVFSVLTSYAQSRYIEDISTKEWHLWLDKNADWKNDALYLPFSDLSKIQIHSPTGGWDVLEKGKIVNLPAVVEQYFWGTNGSKYGVTGNYVGVSWFYSTMNIPENFKNRRIVLQFESVRMRAEVYINRKLSGYDFVDGTPFEVDITDQVIYGKENEIAVRITDPNGGFDWRDNLHFEWGDNVTMASKGFGGITGKVKLVVTDKSYIKDVFIKNRPTPNQIEVQVELNKVGKGKLKFNIQDDKNGIILISKSLQVNVEDSLISAVLIYPAAKLWSPDQPNLYNLNVVWESNNGNTDNVTNQFGFRWFEIKSENGDKQFFLNGRRIFLLSAISWSFWPDNGIFASQSLAEKQITTAKSLGLNMLNFHRAIGQPNVFEAADKLGLLLYEEPGGYQSHYNQYPLAKDSIAENIEFINKWRRIKMFRMMKRDRNHPSLIIYNFNNERSVMPNRQDSIDLIDAQKIDPTRIITYDSPHLFPGLNGNPYTPYAQKLHVIPYKTGLQNQGWWDEHHAGGPGCYHDGLYQYPTNYYKYTTHKSETIFWGEEGAIGTPPRLGLIKAEIQKSQFRGWETDDYLNWHNAYDKFLADNKGFRKIYLDVDTLCRKIANVSYYYQGRMIENARISNITDGYAINGWESMKLENHSGIVDNYRNPKGDVNLIAAYNKPLYISVKLRNKVIPAGKTTLADFFIVNQVNLKGNYTLNIIANNAGRVIYSKSLNVNITGGTNYGEIICSGIEIPNIPEGYTTINAELTSIDKVVAKGTDRIYAVCMTLPKINLYGSVADSSGLIYNFLSKNNIKVENYNRGKPKGAFLVIGESSPKYVRTQTTDILNWVNEGGTLIIVGRTNEWAEYLSQKEVIDYRGCKEMGKVWLGGNFFSKPHSLFEGLPQGCVYNWEYQCFSTYNKNRVGLRINSGETIVAAVSDHSKEVFSALSLIPLGQGKIIITSLDIMSCLNGVATNDTSLSEKSLEGENGALETLNSQTKSSANVVAQRLLLNMISSSGFTLKERIITTPNLVALWDFKENESEARLAVGKRNFPLIEVGGKLPRINEGVVSGYSASFDGKAYLKLPNKETKELNISGDNKEITVVAWVKWTGEQQGFVGGMWNEYEDGGKRQYGLFVSLPYYNGKNKVCGHISKTGKPTPPFPYSIDYSASKQEVPANKWQCVAFTYDGKYIKSYMNGHFEATEPELINNTKGFEGYPNGLTHSKNPYYYPDGMGNNGSDFTVGAVLLKSGMGNNFKGQISGLAVYDRALSDEELSNFAIK